jgi:hypothetical protein
VSLPLAVRSRPRKGPGGAGSVVSELRQEPSRTDAAAGIRAATVTVRMPAVIRAASVTVRMPACRGRNPGASMKVWASGAMAKVREGSLKARSRFRMLGLNVK